MSRHVSLLVLSLVAAACDETGRSGAAVTLEGHGTGATTFVDGTFTITLHRADVAFGPAYFCATTGSSTELCETAVLETLDVHAIDATDATAQPLGELRGVTGDVRSIQYDLGIAFLLADTKPRPLATSIDGHSVVLEGTATDGITTFDFIAAIDVAAKVSGNTAIVGARTNAAIPGSGATLTLGLDPASWLVGLDWAGLAGSPHAPGTPVEIAAGTSDHDTILRGITTNAPVTFVWSTP